MSKTKGIRFLALIFISTAFCCSEAGSKKEILAVDLPLHLEDHLDTAKVKDSEIPKEIPSVVEWRFDKDQPDWKPVIPLKPKVKAVEAKRINDGLRLTLSKENKYSDHLNGGVVVNLPDWSREDWGYILIRARTKEKIDWIWVGYNLRTKAVTQREERMPFLYTGDSVEVITDGSVQNYLLRADLSYEEWKDPWRQLGILIESAEPASLDILSVSVIPKEANYSQSKVGVRNEVRNKVYRRSLFTHAPGKLEYQVKIPEEGRIDTGLGILRGDAPVTFKVLAKAAGREGEVLFEEKYSDKGCWAQRAVDLSRFSGKTITLTLETDAERAGTVALWGAPTLSGKRTTKKPNVVFYVIDAGAAEYMSVYGYNRRTTPNLERLGAEGAVFEHAYSNSAFTNDSVPSFMTSLHSSVLGGYRYDGSPLPEQAQTMAQRLHKAGYQTEVLTSNPYCGVMSNMDRGADVLEDSELGENIAPSKKLNKDFWDWRKAYPGEPYWIHFQPTDVHMPWRAIAPFSGLYVDPEIRPAYEKVFKQLLEFSGDWEERWDSITVDHAKFSYAARCFYAETIAQIDYEIGQLAERLKAAGEWDHTLFIVAADHGHYAGGLPVLDPLPPKWGTPIFASQKSRIPLIIVWPEKIPPGQRISQPISMIDMLPTILDLAGLPPPEIMQGQSLTPLLLGQPGWKPQPVIFDEFEAAKEMMYGTIEVVDGRWGASLSIDPRPDDKKTPREKCRPAPLLLYDIWDDPYCVNSLHKERADLVEKYTKYIEQVWKGHRALAKKFTRTGKVSLTSEQIENLRSLGYIR